jgi:ParB/RepB/Spo0J family partition protein
MPITVRPRQTADGAVVYELVDGRQRLQACKELGFDMIPCVVKDMDDKTAIIMQMTLNHNRVETSRREYMAAFTNLLALDKNLTIEALASITGFSSSFIRDHLSLKGIQSETANKLLDDGLPLAKAKIIAKAPVEVQDKLAEIAVGTSAEEFESEAAAVIKTNKEAAPKKEAAPAVFEPKATLKDKATILAIIGDSAAISSIIATNSCSTMDDAVVAALKFILDLDANGVAAQKAKWDEKEAEKAKKAAERTEKAAQAKASFEALKNIGATGVLGELSAEQKAARDRLAETRKKMMAEAAQMVKDGKADNISAALVVLNNQAKAAEAAAAEGK